MNIILPKTLVLENFQQHPLYFLAGPVRGGGDWQLECTKLLEKEILRKTGRTDFNVAIPYYHETLPADHPLAAMRMKGKEDRFTRQLNWERYYLEIASKQGCIIFWLPEESKTDPRADGAYATDTRGELGEWRGHLCHDSGIRLVVGGEEGFPSMSQIERNFQVATGLIVHRTLDETVEGAIRMSIPSSQIHE